MRFRRTSGGRRELSWLALALLPLVPVAAMAESTFASDFVRVLTFQDYNTRVVVIGTMLLGLASGLVGTFLLLRKRALLSDAISHAMLPGICAAFVVMALAGGSGKHLGGLLLGAAISGILGTAAVTLIRKTARLKEDVALAIVLSTFFGFGIVLLGVAQRLGAGEAAGLKSFIYGKTASMLLSDALLIAIFAAVAAAICAALFKEFGLLCFDAEFGRTQGWPTGLLDATLMALVVLVTVIGLQAVGLIMMVALLVIPPSAARFWTDDLRWMAAISSTIGALSGLFGSAASALMGAFPAGAIIVLVATLLFVLSLLLGTRRGVVHRSRAGLMLRRKVTSQHLLRGLYELAEREHHDPKETAASFEDLLAERSWTRAELQRALARHIRQGLIRHKGGGYALTRLGYYTAVHAVRTHRLWEMYLIAHADVAPSHVDTGADTIEHVLEPDLIARLETMLADRGSVVPPSPHPLKGMVQT
ncbi:MAG: iron chelate uptake ABC transporter family permease subunit [Sumerlaeia bacterium]